MNAAGNSCGLLSVLIDVARNWILILILVIVGLSACSPTVNPEKSPPVERIDEPVDPIDRLELSEEMKRAVHKARSELPEFWAAWKDNSYGQGDYIVSAQFMNEDGSRGEFLWMSVEAYGEGEVTGLIETVPTMDLNVKAGERVTVPEGQIVDWMFVPEDGDHKGGYTLGALGTSPGN